MDANAELGLVRKAIESRLSNCCDWISGRVQQRTRNDRDLQGLQVIKLLKEWVRDQGGEIYQRVREPADKEYDTERRYYCLIPVDCLPRDLFVKFILWDEDPDCPVVKLVSVHLTSHH